MNLAQAEVIDGLRAALDAVIGNVTAARVLARSGVLAPVRPDRLARMAIGALRYGFTLTAGYAAGAARHPDRTATTCAAGCGPT